MGPGSWHRQGPTVRTSRCVRRRNLNQSVQAPPRDPELKDIIERTNGYLKRSFSQAGKATVRRICKNRSMNSLAPWPIPAPIPSRTPDRSVSHEPIIHASASAVYPNDRDPFSCASATQLPPHRRHQPIQRRPCIHRQARDRARLSGRNHCHRTIRRNRRLSPVHVITDPTHQHATQRMRQLTAGPNDIPDIRQ